MDPAKKGRPKGARQFDKIHMKKIRRTCLKCERIFMAEGRFNRLCPRCNQLLSEHYSHIQTGYIYPNTFYAIKPGSGPRKKPLRRLADETGKPMKLRSVLAGTLKGNRRRGDIEPPTND